MQTKQNIKDQVDWQKVMSAPGYAGGHEEVMKSLFGDNAKVIAEYIEDDYQGTEAFAYEFPDGTVAILTDYFGSCSGCDSWEDSSDEDARKMIESLVHSTRIFPAKQQAAEWSATVEDRAEDYPFYAARNLVFQ